MPSSEDRKFSALSLYKERQKNLLYMCRNPAHCDKPVAYPPSYVLTLYHAIPSCSEACTGEKGGTVWYRKTKCLPFVPIQKLLEEVLKL
jgi:hypothetical protein